MTTRCLLTLVLLVAASPVRADSPAPERSYTKAVPGGKFVFVMISPLTAERDASQWNETIAAEIREIRRVYTRSGMYRTGEIEPLWTVDWYAHGVHLTADGVHLIRPGPWASLRPDRSPDLECDAVSFYAGGRLLRTYRVAELIDNPRRLAPSASHYSWQTEGRFSGEFEYTIETADGNRFVFDVRTGNVVTASRAGRVSRWVWWVAGGVALAAVAWLASRRKRAPVPGDDRR
jgi:hypothetical protein